MLGPIGSRVIDLLKVMTPSEIDRYITKKEAKVSSMPMAAGAEEFSLNSEIHSHLSSKNSTDQDEEASNSDDQQLEHGAKIIPLDKNLSSMPEQIDDEPYFINREDDEFDLLIKKNVESTNELEKMGILSARKIQEINKIKKDREKRSEQSSTSFLLSQREKLKNLRSKMVESDAIKNYVKSINFESTTSEIDIDNLEEETSVGNKGILINKKQY